MVGGIAGGISKLLTKIFSEKVYHVGCHEKDKNNIFNHNSIHKNIVCLIKYL